MLAKGGGSGGVGGNWVTGCCSRGLQFNCCCLVELVIRVRCATSEGEQQQAAEEEENDDFLERCGPASPLRGHAGSPEREAGRCRIPHNASNRTRATKP